MNNDVSPKLSRKEREYLRHKEEILWAAETVFSEKGYVSATVEEIAQRAEFSVGTLYRFFENKSDLYSEAVLARMRMMEQEVYAALREGDSLVEAIRNYFASRIELFWKHPQFFRLFYSGPVGTISDANLGFLPEILERYQKLLNELHQLFREGVKQKEFKPRSPELLTLAIEGLLKTYVEHLSRQREPHRNEKEEDELFQVFLTGAAAQ
jgi:AcrR family transcriptional regulator